MTAGKRPSSALLEKEDFGLHRLSFGAAVRTTGESEHYPVSSGQFSSHLPLDGFECGVLERGTLVAVHAIHGDTVRITALSADEVSSRLVGDAADHAFALCQRSLLSRVNGST